MGERLVDATGRRAGEDHPEPEVPVGRPADGLVEATLLDQPPAAHGREPEDEVPLQDRAALVLHLEAPGMVVDIANLDAVRDDQRVARQDVEVRAQLSQLAQSLEIVLAGRRRRRRESRRNHPSRPRLAAFLAEASPPFSF